MNRIPSWEIIYTVTKRNGQKEKTLPEYIFDASTAVLIQELKKKTKDLADKYDFSVVMGEAVSIDGIDRNKNLVNYSNPTEIHTFTHENEQ